MRKDGNTEVRKPSDSEPFAALAFKIAVHPFYGKLIYTRVLYSGKVEQGGSGCSTPPPARRSALARCSRCTSNTENPVDAAHAGHIYAFVGLKDTRTGDTLCAQNAPVVLESMTFPEPVIHVAIEPKSKGDQEKLSIAIQKLAEEDPTFSVRQTPRPARPSSAAWASFTLTFLLTA